MATPSSVEPLKTRTVLPGSAVSDRMGIVSLVTAPLESVALTTGLTSSEAELMTGAFGTEVSTVSKKVAEGPLVFPAASVAVAVRLCAPDESGDAGVNVNVPAGPSTALPRDVEPSNNVTVAPGSAVKTSVGRASLVDAPLERAPVTGPTSSLVLTQTGAAGAVESTVKGNAVDGPLVLPAMSVAVAVRLCSPSDKGEAGVNEKLPGLVVDSVAVPSSVVPS